MDGMVVPQRNDYGTREESTASRNEHSDDVLFQRTISGDEKALIELIAATQGRIRKRCLSIFRGDADTADEACSRILWKIYHDLPGNRHDIRRFGAWLGTVTRNVCVDLMRNQRSDQQFMERFQTHQEVLLGTEGQAAVPGPEQFFNRLELGDALRTAFARLPREQRYAASERLLRGESYIQIARAQQTTEANVRKRVQLARRCLQSHLSDYCAAKGLALNAGARG